MRVSDFQPGATSTAVAGRPSSGTVPIAGLAALCVLAAVLPWLLQMRVSEALLASVQVVLAVVGLVRGCRPGARLVQIVTFSFLLVWLGIAPIYQLSHQRAAWGDSALLTQRVDVFWALALNLFATAALLVGFSLAARRAGAGERTSGRASVRGVVPWLYVVACLAVTPAAVAASGGLSGMFSSRAERTSAWGERVMPLAGSSGAAIGLLAILPTALALSAAYLFLLRTVPLARTSGLRGVPALEAHGLVVAVALLVLHGNFLTTTRFISTAAFGSLVVLLLQPRSGRAGLWFGGVALGATVLLYPLANVFRSEEFRTTSGAEAFATPDFDGFQQIVNAMVFSEDVGHSLGHYTSSALLFFVPRSLWEGKATPASIDVAEHRGYEFTNLSLPLPAELFLDFGMVGMVVLMFLLGWGLGWMDTQWLLSPDSRTATLVPYASLAMLGVLRGPLGSNAPVYLTTLGLLFLGVQTIRGSTAVGRGD